nr:isoform 6 of sarcolemmal membrane-associated protein [Quercus suber]
MGSLPHLALVANEDVPKPASSTDKLSTMPRPIETTSPGPHLADLPQDSITVRLVPVANDRLERTITIKRGEAVPIGRSSHDLLKGLSPKTDNALFDCPVVSRRHAELVWRAEKEMSDIIIVDYGSSHGTFVNGVRLKRGEDFLLKSDDLIRLGCEINSHMGNHEGITFRFAHVEIPKATPTATKETSTRRGFCLYGDEESETGSVIDDDDSSVVKDQPSSSNHTTPDSKTDQASALPGSQHQPIDLDQPNLTLRNVIEVDDDVAVVPSFKDLESHPLAIEVRETQPAVETQPSFYASFLAGGEGTQQRENVLGDWDGVEYPEHFAGGATSDAVGAESGSDEHEYDDDESSSGMFLAKTEAADLVSEPYSVDEAPERMSSKKRASPAPDNIARGGGDNPKSGSYNVPGTLQYDPVRGSQPPASASAVPKESIPKPRYTYGTSHFESHAALDTDFGLNSRWDVGPPPDASTRFPPQTPSFLTEQYNTCDYVAPPPCSSLPVSQSQYYSYPFSEMPVSKAQDQDCNEASSAFEFHMPATSAPVLANELPSQAQATLMMKEMLSRAARNDAPYCEVDTVVEGAPSSVTMKKRKADEMSQDEPLELHDAFSTTHASQIVEPDAVAGGQDSRSLPAGILTSAQVQPKAKRARTAGTAARSIVKAAGKVIGLTALGGIATAYFLQSPVAEALCEWL